MFGERESWNLNIISIILPDFVVKVIKAIPRQIISPVEDCLKWHLTPNGQFSLKSAVDFICSNNTLVEIT